jgi:putative transcriptional regulator
MTRFYPIIAFFIVIVFFTFSLILSSVSDGSVGTNPHAQVRIPDIPDEPLFSIPDTKLSKGKFLVAKRTMIDPRFMHSVILLIEYSMHGAVGLIINQPSEVRLSEALPEIEELKGSKDFIYIGGPVSMDKMMMLIQSDKKIENARHVIENIYVSSSRSLLKKIMSEGDKGKRFHVYTGYAGWAPAQLEGEVMRGSWYVLTVDPDIIFHAEPSELWPELIRRHANQWIWHIDSQ